ncbi:hypothetical protein I3842_10G002300 [Carya illinoinensis]|uniref:PHD-type domain-containing protein n=1 Tax=Carya illinoinensis TaxID=32201 RepID=A0A922DUG6_CARIL|nr:hypothetical protein I3842_10G002300 [Carya illinoinensis]
MKRVSESQPEPGDSLDGGTWAKTTQASSSYIEVSNTTNNDFKRFKGSVVNGLIVYTRERKSWFNWSTGLFENGHNKQLCSSDETGINVNASLEEGFNGKKVQIVLGDEPTCKGRELSIAESSEGKNDLPEEVSLFTPSLVRPKVKPEPPESLVNASDAAQNEKILYLDMGATGGVSSTLENKLELKTSKKIGLNKKPMTVKELFETGLLDGVTVVYVGCNKFQASGLRGTIRDGGILCSCTSCNGCRVIPPSKFEIHASKTYKRAAQYICLENGKSLLDLLRECRASSLITLESTIQNIIGSPPEEKYFTCKRCKGCFPKSCVARIGLLCNSCVALQECHGVCNGPSDFQTLTSLLISKSTRNASTYLQTPFLNKVKVNGISSLLFLGLLTCSQLHYLRSPKRVPFSKNSKSASACFPSQNKRPWKITTKPSKSIMISRSSKSASLSIPSQNKTKWKITTKDQRLHKLVFEEGGLPDRSEVAYYARGQVSALQFEVHAGWASRRKPYAYIYTSNGVSLHGLAISLSKGRKYSAKDNDNLCIICADGGNLLLCDGCPRAFHKECASLSSIPRGDWYCTYCQNMFQREKFVEHNENAVAAGRVSGIDPIEQITKRCIRIVKNIEADLSGCVLCRGYDFSKSGFGPRTILLCDQELPEGEWFCSVDCTRISSTLQKLLVRGAEKLPDSLLDVIKRKQEEQGLDSINDMDVRWRLLRGKIASPETRFYLSEAVAIFHDCFAPIIDSISGQDLIPAMVYGRNTRGQEFGGMYCAILMVNSFVVSAGILRVFGPEVAELPLVATSKGNHGKGYFQILFSCIEKLLSFLNVKNLVLPAAEEAESIWKDKFGFERLKPDQLRKYSSCCCQMVTFKGTSMLQKMVRQCRVMTVE